MPVQKDNSSPRFSLPVDLPASSKKYYHLIFTVLIACLIAASIPLFFIPQINRILKTRKEIKTLQKKEESLNTKLTQLQSLDQADLTLKTQILTQALPSEKAIAESLLGLSALAQKHNLSITSFSLTPGIISTESAKVTTKPEDLKIKIALAGATPDLEAFLAQTTHITPLISLEEASIEYPNTITLQVNSVWAPLPTKLPPVETPLPAISNKDQEFITLLQTFSPNLTTPVDFYLTFPSGKPNPFSP